MTDIDASYKYLNPREDMQGKKVLEIADSVFQQSTSETNLESLKLSFKLRQSKGRSSADTRQESEHKLATPCPSARFALARGVLHRRFECLGDEDLARNHQIRFLSSVLKRRVIEQTNEKTTTEQTRFFSRSQDYQKATGKATFLSDHWEEFM